MVGTEADPTSAVSGWADTWPLDALRSLKSEGGIPHMKLHMVGTANRRISNIEPQNIEGWNRFAQSFLK